MHILQGLYFCLRSQLFSTFLPLICYVSFHFEIFAECRWFYFCSFVFRFHGRFRVVRPCFPRFIFLVILCFTCRVFVCIHTIRFACYLLIPFQRLFILRFCSYTPSSQSLINVSAQFLTPWKMLRNILRLLSRNLPRTQPLTFPSTSDNFSLVLRGVLCPRHHGYMEHLVYTAKENAITTSCPIALSLIRQTRGLDKARKRYSFTPLLRVFQTGAQHGILLAHQSYRLPSGQAQGIKSFALPATVMGTSLGILDLYQSVNVQFFVCYRKLSQLMLFLCLPILFVYFVLFLALSSLPTPESQPGGFSNNYYNPFPGLRTGFLARLGCGSSLLCVPSSPAIFPLFTFRCLSPHSIRKDL